jgi:hypothetical protein
MVLSMRLACISYLICGGCVQEFSYNAAGHIGVVPCMSPLLPTCAAGLCAHNPGTVPEVK